MEQFLSLPIFKTLLNPNPPQDLLKMSKQLEHDFYEFRNTLQLAIGAEDDIVARYKHLRYLEYEIITIQGKLKNGDQQDKMEIFNVMVEYVNNILRLISTELDIISFIQHSKKQLSESNDIQAENRMLFAKWVGKKNELTELLTALFYSDRIRTPEGKRYSYRQFCQCVGELFGVSYRHPHDDKDKIMRRKRGVSPFLETLQVVLLNKNEEMTS